MHEYYCHEQDNNIWKEVDKTHKCISIYHYGYWLKNIIIHKAPAKASSTISGRQPREIARAYISGSQNF